MLSARCAKLEGSPSRADADGRISLDLKGRRHTIATSREHARTRVLIICTGLHMRIIRELTIDPTRNYQPTGKPRGRPKNKSPQIGGDLCGMS